MIYYKDVRIAGKNVLKNLWTVLNTKRDYSTLGVHRAISYRYFLLIYCNFFLVRKIMQDSLSK